MMFEQISDQLRQAEHTRQDAGEQNQEKGCVGGTPGLGDATLEQRRNGIRHGSDGTQQLVVDTSNERNGAT